MTMLRNWLSRLYRDGTKNAGKDDERVRISSIYSRIEKEMVRNRIYLDPDLSLESLSRMIGTNRTYVSKAICRYESGFRTYVNRYRTQHLMSILNDGDEILNYPRDGEMLALDAGFPNRRSMDRVLKKEKGMTLYLLRKKRYSELKK